VYTLAPAAIGQIAGERTMTAWHPQTGAPTAWAQGGTADAWTDRWYHYDMLGNVTGELDASGLVQSHVWMEAFGTVLSGGQTGRRLTTKTYDPDAGLYYFSASWYGANAGAWLQREPLGIDGPNLYWFARDRPSAGFDPNGLHYWDCPTMAECGWPGWRTPANEPLPRWWDLNCARACEETKRLFEKKYPDWR
jgi:RHS repeat-associated protein